MAEPQPDSVQEGAADPHAPTSTAEDRKAAAALSALDAADDDSNKKEVDSKALGEAMKNLAVADNKSKAPAKKEVAVGKKKVVKVDAKDVELLVGTSGNLRHTMGLDAAGWWTRMVRQGTSSGLRWPALYPSMPPSAFNPAEQRL
jgi:hypothetical protein